MVEMLTKMEDGQVVDVNGVYKCGIEAIYHHILFLLLQHSRAKEDTSHSSDFLILSPHTITTHVTAGE